MVLAILKKKYKTFDFLIRANNRVNKHILVLFLINV